MEGSPPPLYVIVPGRVYRPDNDATHTPAVPPGRGARGRRGRHARRPQGHAARVRARDLRRRARGAAASRLLPVHRAQRRGRRVVLQLQPRRTCATARAARCARARAGSRSSAPAWSTRTCSPTSRDPGYDPEVVTGFAFGMGIERIAMLRHGDPRPAPVLRERPALPAPVREPLMLVPLYWLREHCDPAPRDGGARGALTLHGPKVERTFRHGPPSAEHYVVGHVLEAVQHPERRPAARLHRRGRRGRAR